MKNILSNDATKTTNPFIALNSEGKLDRSETASHIDAGLILVQDIEIFRTEHDDGCFSNGGAMGYHLLLESLRQAVTTLEESAL